MVDLRLPPLKLLPVPDRPEPPTPTTPLLPAPKIAGLLPAVTGHAYAWIRVMDWEYASVGHINKVYTRGGELTIDLSGVHPYPQASGFRVHLPYRQVMWTRPTVDRRYVPKRWAS